MLAELLIIVSASTSSIQHFNDTICILEIDKKLI